MEHNPMLLAPERFQQALRAVGAGAWEWSIETDKVTWSDENYLVMGLVPGSVEASFDEWCRHVHPDDLQGALSSVQAAVDQKKDLDIDYRVLWPSGEERWIKDIGRIVLDPSGKAVGMFGIQLDITSHKKSERAIRDAELMYRRIVETTNEGIWIMSPENRTVFVNQRMAELLGFPVEDLRKGQLFDFLDSQSKTLASTELVGSKVNVSELDLCFKRKDGTHMWAIVKANAMMGPKGLRMGFLFMVTDITRLRKQRDELSRSREDLRRLSAALARAREAERTRVARELHDELGQSLTALKIDLQILEARVPSQDSEGKERVNTARFLLNRTIESVRRLASDLRPGILDDLGLCAAVEWELQEFTKRTRVKTRLDEGHVLDELAGENVIVAFRVLQEALTNVIRHAQATEVVARIRRRGNSVFMSITDNGRGFTHQDSGPPQTLGILGMQERAASVGAELQVLTKRGEGTTITLTIPNAQDSGANIAVKETAG